MLAAAWRVGDVWAQAAHTARDALASAIRQRPLPRLPLPVGTRIVGLGHSFIQRGGYSGRNNGSNGVDYAARGVLSQIRNLDPRFGIEYFAAGNLPWPGQSGANSLTGSMQGIGGDHLLAIWRAPGTINRTSYVLSLAPGIVYLDVGSNDIASGVGGPFGSDGSARAVIAALDRQIGLLTRAGVWVVVQTLAWRDWAPGKPADPRYAATLAVNAWIRAQVGRAGVRICDTVAIDGTAARDAAAFSPDGVHPNALGAARRAAILLPILQQMVAPSVAPIEHPSPLAAVPNNGAHVAGPIAAGWTASITAGKSTAVAIFDRSARTATPQQFTISPAADGTADGMAVHELRLTARDLTLPDIKARTGARSGDWLEIAMPFELDDWAGWRIFDRGGAGPLMLNAELFSKGAIIFEANDLSAYPQPGRSRTTGRLRDLLWLRTNDPQAVLRWSSRPVVLHFDSRARGSGTVRIGLPTIRRIADPRKAWGL